jgi:hypothetical protein
MSGVRVGICGILQANKLLKLVARTISRKQRDDVSAQIRALKGHESLAQGLPRVCCFIAARPHKALPSSALLGKTPGPPGWRC